MKGSQRNESKNKKEYFVFEWKEEEEERKGKTIDISLCC